MDLHHSTASGTAFSESIIREAFQAFLSSSRLRDKMEKNTAKNFYFTKNPLPDFSQWHSDGAHLVVVMTEHCYCDGGTCPVVRCHNQMPGQPHIVTLCTVHTSLNITLSSIANQRARCPDFDQSEAWNLNSLRRLSAASVIIEASDPSSCLLSHDNNIYCQTLNMKI